MISNNGISLFQKFGSYATTDFGIEALYRSPTYPKEFRSGMTGTISFYKYKYIINS